jgi:DNA-binding transcriptional LysR family regulator
MRLDPLALECFLAVSETGSFTRAAGQVNRTQSAVSQQIAKLETQLDSPLFIRGKHFTLTTHGEILRGYAKQILALQREAIERFNQPELEGEISFGLPEDFASVFLADVLSEYIKQHPRISLKLECDLTLNLFKRFQNNEFDLVLVKMNKPEDLPNGIEVWSEALEWVGNANLFSSDPNQAIPLVLSPQPCVYRTRAIKALEKAKRKWRIVLASPSYASQVAAVKAGMGITVLPKNMIPDTIDIIWPNETVPKLDDTHISLLKHRSDNPVVDNLEKFVLSKLR